MKDTIYFKQADLLLQILPMLRELPQFALKGGTAINFFIRNLPRLSIDIDLVYLPLNQRDEALNDISDCLEKLSGLIAERLTNVKIFPKRTVGSNFITALIVNMAGITVKIEPNLVVRGIVFPTERRELCSSAQQLFERSLSTNTLSLADLYGSKICAALDRQHPRDLFDVHLLLQNEGLTDDVRTAFIVYLLSHPRPMVELLQPNPQDIRPIYEQEFKGMSFQELKFEELIETRKYLFEKMKTWLTNEEK